MINTAKLDGAVAVPATPQRAADPSQPPCLAVDDALVAALLVRQQRVQPPLIRFCVPAPDAPWLRGLFDSAVAPDPSAGPWMVSQLIHESIAPQQQTLTVQRYTGEVDLASATQAVAEPRDDQRVFALLTLTLRDETVRRETAGWSPILMERNTFRLLGHAGASDVQRLYLAYFMHQESVLCQGVKGGFLEVHVDAAGYFGVDDAARRTRISAPTLPALVATLEKFTGLRYCNAAKDLQAVTVDPACNLFVDEEQTRSLRDPAQHLPFNAALDPFAPLDVVVADYPSPLPMYRSSFLLLSDQIIYADAHGQTGTLEFGRHVVQGARQLRCPSATDRTVATRYGLHPGVFYRIDDVAERLEQQGLIWMPDPAPSWSPEPHHCAATASTSPPPPPVRNLRLPPLHFHFQDGVLHYTDEHDQPGLLAFDHATTTPAGTQRYRLIDRPGSRDAAFAAEHGLQPGAIYTQAQIVYQLYRAGFDPMDAGTSPT